MPPSRKTNWRKQDSTYKFNTKDKLKKMKKPKKINRKLRDRVVDAKGLNYDMREAIEGAFKYLEEEDHDQLKSTLEQIQLDLQEQKLHIQYIDTRLSQKADRAIEECVYAAVTMSGDGHIITQRALSED